MSFVRRLVLIGFFAAFLLSYLGPITEGDFFWHLKAGQSVWETGEIPPVYSSTQWLGQLAIYLIWRLGGFDGIVLLRSLIYTSILAALFLWMRRRDVPFFISLFFILFPASMFMYFPSERPQLFSFMFFPVTVFLLEEFRRSPAGDGWLMRRSYFLLPPLIILWAFVHAGFLIGLAAVWVYFFSELVYFIRGKSSLRKMAEGAMISIFPLFVAAFDMRLIGHFLQMAGSILTLNPYMESVMEYLSPVTAALDLGQYFPAYWVFLCAALYTILRNIKKMPLQHVLLIVILAAISLRSLRFMPFLVMLAPLAALYNVPRGGRWGESRLLTAGFSVVLALWAVFMPKDFSMGISREFPSEAVRFLGSVDTGQGVFNYQGWAGYLMWSLPEKKIFMPVENVTRAADDAYNGILWAKKTVMYGRKPEWRAVLYAYGLDTVIMPGMSPVSGEVFPLLNRLVADKDWFLVYTDPAANVFVRGTPENAGLIRIYSSPKANAYLQVASQAWRLLEKEPDNKAFKRSLSFARKRYKELGGIRPPAKAPAKKKQG